MTKNVFLSSVAIASISTLLLSGCQQSNSGEKQTSTNSTLSTSAPDLCIDGGTIYTGVISAPQATAVTVSGGKIVDVLTGDGDYCAQFTDGKTKTINLASNSMYPGFVDAHGHLLGIGLREMTLNLEGTPSIKALKEKLAVEVKKTDTGTVIYGRGWIETHWPENRFPTRQDLDEVAPNNPVILQRSDGHAMVANSAALKLARITPDTKPPFGGDILKDNDGNPTGMLIDNAMGLVSGLQAELSDERRAAAYIKASEVYAGYGWTGIQSMSVNAQDVALIERLSDEGKLKIRVYNAIDMQDANTVLDGITQNGAETSDNNKIVTRAIKLYADGALGSRGAALLEPYADDPNNTGLMVTTHEDIMPILERALRDGIQISTHAIGDRANRLVLDWYEETFNKVPVNERKIADPRWRIEHAQIVEPGDLTRFSQLGIIASMQPSHAIGDLFFAPDRLGHDRLRGGYAWRTLIDSGVIVAAGSDAPVERGDPRVEYYAAVARKGLNGFSNDDWYPNEKVTRAEALTMFTAWPAYAAFAESSAGTIEVGKDADFTVFSQDIMVIPENDILSVKTAYTIVAGDIVHQE
jgi:predicted amidohydrolase YtcJ